MPLARIAADGAVRYYLADALGSIIALTDESGSVKARYNYSPFGVTEIVLDTDGSGASNPFRFTGREQDETGLYYYRARYYNPEMGRFLSEDPIRFAGGDVNWYAYVHNRPLNLVDPLGLVNWGKVWSGIGLEFAGYALIGTGVGVTVVAAIMEGPLAAAHVGSEVGIVGMISFGGFTWWQGVNLIKEGFSEPDVSGDGVSCANGGRK